MDNPSGNFRFLLFFSSGGLADSGGGSPVSPAAGAFSECSGLEATMEPRIIREGGLNYGAHVRSGAVSFSTLILRRGMSDNSDLWAWWGTVTLNGGFSRRMDLQIQHLDLEGNPIRRWTIRRALPVKFKSSDLNARSTEIAIEELHLAHEGLENEA
jgi:phage tail-like protein